MDFFKLENQNKSWLLQIAAGSPTRILFPGGAARDDAGIAVTGVCAGDTCVVIAQGDITSGAVTGFTSFRQRFRLSSPNVRHYTVIQVGNGAFVQCQSFVKCFCFHGNYSPFLFN
jgi:hypothetical protein